MDIIRHLRQSGWELKLDAQSLVIEFGHSKRWKRLVTIHSYEPTQKTVMV
jgi:hypothetical protein